MININKILNILNDYKKKIYTLTIEKKI